MNKIDALTSYMAEIVDIMQEVQQKMQRVKEIKAEMEKLKKVETKATKVTNTTNNNKITCECGCKINKSSWYIMFFSPVVPACEVYCSIA